MNAHPISTRLHHSYHRALRTWLCVGPFALASPNAVLAQQPVHAGTPVPFEAEARTAATTVRFGHQPVAVYELLVGNPSADHLIVTALDVMDSEGRVLVTQEGDALAALSQRIPASDSAQDGRLALAPGGRALIFLWIRLPGPDAATPFVRHRFRLSSAEADVGTEFAFDGPDVALDSMVVHMDAPVRGGVWLASNGLANDANHRRFYTASGTLLIPQRFGADFHKLGIDGNNASPERPLTNESFHAYGEPLYAVADGVVSSVLRGLPDNAVGTTPSGLSWEDIPGNHVVLRIGGGYALYAHLQDESIAVAPGDTVSRGQLVGRIGNSGNTSVPHLHFHVAAGADPNLSEGVPAVFRSYEVLVEDYSFASDQIPVASEGRRERFSLPKRGRVVSFPTTPFVGQDGAPVRLRAADGVTVHGWVHGEPATARALLLLFHQGGANARAEYDPIIPRLLEEGYAVLAIDQRAGGDMLGGENRTAHALGGDPHYCDAYPDLEAALAYGREQVPGRPIVVWGSSYSGALALRLAMDNPDLAGLVGFSPAGGEAMGSCPASRFAEHVTVPTLVLRPASELEIDYVRADWEAWGTRGFERHIADPGRHGSSMLNPMRVEGDVEPTWTVVLEFLARVTER